MNTEDTKKVESRRITEKFIEETLIPQSILKTGFEEIDGSAPLVLGQNSIITGRTGTGKTVLAVNIINGILENNPEAKILAFSLELTKKDFFQRLIACEFDMDKWKIERGFKDNEGMEYATEKAGYIKAANEYREKYADRVLIYDDLSVIETMNAEIEFLKQKNNFHPDYIMIDYTNMLTFTRPKENFHLEVSKWFMTLAKKSNTHVQAICQANRMTTEKKDGFARTENLADSDQYGRDAYIVYSLKSDDNLFYINPTKNRNGRTENVFTFEWNPKSNKIKQAVDTSDL